jgi:hypothetical protein
MKPIVTTVTEPLEMSISLTARPLNGYPVPYEIIVEKTEANDFGDTVMVGLSLCHRTLYFWINDDMHSVSVQELVNAVVPKLLPTRYVLTDDGERALKAGAKGAKK